MGSRSATHSRLRGAARRRCRHNESSARSRLATRMPRDRAVWRGSLPSTISSMMKRCMARAFPRRFNSCVIRCWCSSTLCSSSMTLGSRELIACARDRTRCTAVSMRFRRLQSRIKHRRIPRAQAGWQRIGGFVWVDVKRRNKDSCTRSSARKLKSVGTPLRRCEHNCSNSSESVPMAAFSAGWLFAGGLARRLENGRHHREPVKGPRASRLAFTSGRVDFRRGVAGDAPLR
jgi:hypothetical protein